MKKLFLMVTVCATLCLFSILNVQAADIPDSTITFSDNVLPKQGWYCAKALRYFHSNGLAFSRLKLEGPVFLRSYDNMIEQAFISASDNYSTVCVYVYTNNTWRAWQSF